MSLKNRIAIILLGVLGVGLSGCRSENDLATLTANAPATPVVITATPIIMPDVTPTQETGECAGLPGEGFVLVNQDPCLNSLPVTRTNGQTAPAEWGVVNILETVEGLSGDDFFAGYARITPTEARGNFPPEDGYQFAVEGVAGLWGFSQRVDVEAGCYIVKVRWSASVVEIENAGQGGNIGIHPFLNDMDLQMVAFPGGRVTDEWVWPTWLDAGTVTLEVYAQAAYATAMPGTEVILHIIALALDEDADHCSGA